VFAVQDGNGDMRQAFLQVSCSTIAQILDSTGPTLLQLYNLVPILSDLNLCPPQASALAAAYRRYQAGGAATQSVTNNSLVKSLAGTTQGLTNLFLPHVPTH
jgi:hypothetical protein